MNGGTPTCRSPHLSVLIRFERRPQAAPVDAPVHHPVLDLPTGVRTCAVPAFEARSSSSELREDSGDRAHAIADLVTNLGRTVMVQAVGGIHGIAPRSKPSSIHSLPIGQEQHLRRNVFSDRVSAKDPARRRRRMRRRAYTSISGDSSAMGLIAPPIAFQAEWPPFMYFASKPASRSMIAVLQPTWKP